MLYLHVEFSVIFKDRVLFKYTQSTIEIDVIAVTKSRSSSILLKRMQMKRKKASVIITFIIEYA